METRKALDGALALVTGVGRSAGIGAAICRMTSGQSLGSMGSQNLPYAITKAALEMLAPQLGPDLARQGIRIHSVDPGPTDTGWMTEELKTQLRNKSKRGQITIAAILTQKKAQTGNDSATSSGIIHVGL